MFEKVEGAVENYTVGHMECSIRTQSPTSNRFNWAPSTHKQCPVLFCTLVSYSYDPISHSLTLSHTFLCYPSLPLTHDTIHSTKHNFTHKNETQQVSSLNTTRTTSLTTLSPSLS